MTVNAPVQTNIHRNTSTMMLVVGIELAEVIIQLGGRGEGKGK